MFKSTLPSLRCPKLKKGNRPCGGALEARPLATHEEDILSGHLHCEKCQAKFPILAGVAILSPDVKQYVLAHVKGIASLVPDSEIPQEFRRDYLAAKSEIQIEHIEEDLEADRVNALYFMNHYLRVRGGDLKDWYQPASPLIEKLIAEHWDHGPLAQIEKWAAQISPDQKVVELGCGVGGLCSVFARTGTYLGVDSSFAGIALARHLNFGAPYARKIQIPGDLLQGPVSREVKATFPHSPASRADFVVGDLEQPPLMQESWHGVVTLNAIDMLEEPETLPRVQSALLKSGGFAIQSGPYIWHELVARELRARLPRNLRDSARAVEWLYAQNGFKIAEKIDHVPWLFFKHFRQLEVYSVHIFVAKKT